MRRRGTQEAGIPGIPPVAWRTQPFSRKTEGTHFLMMAFSREDTMPERNFPFSERSGQSVPDPFPPVCPQQTGQNSVFLREMSRVAGTIHRQAVVDRCLSQRLHPQSNRKRHRFKRRRAKAGRLRDRARSVGRANGHVAGLFQMARDSGILGGWRSRSGSAFLSARLWFDL